MILRYNVQVCDAPNAVEQLLRDNQAVKAIREDEIQVSFNDHDLGRLGKFIDWLKENEYDLTVVVKPQNLLTVPGIREYNVLCG